MKKYFLIVYMVFNVFFNPITHGLTKQLHILTPMRMLDPKLIEQFEKDNSCEVKVDFIVDESGYESQLRSDIRSLDLVIANEKSLITLTTANLLKVLPPHLQQPNNAKNPLQIKTAFNAEVNTYRPLFINPLGISYKPSISKIPADPTWSILIEPNKNPYWRQHIYLPPSTSISVAVALLAAHTPFTNPKKLPIQTTKWLKSLQSQKALISEPFIYGWKNGELNAGVTFYQDFIRYKRYLTDFNFFIPKDGTYFTRFGIAWCLTSEQEELSKKFIQYIVENTNQFSDFNQLLDINSQESSKVSKRTALKDDSKDFKLWKLYDDASVLPFVPVHN